MGEGDPLCVENFDRQDRLKVEVEDSQENDSQNEEDDVQVQEQLICLNIFLCELRVVSWIELAHVLNLLKLDISLGSTDLGWLGFQAEVVQLLW